MIGLNFFQNHLLTGGHWTNRLSSTSSTDESRNENLEKDFLSPLVPPPAPTSSSADSEIWHSAAGVDVELTIFPVAAWGVKTRRNLKGRKKLSESFQFDLYLQKATYVRSLTWMYGSKIVISMRVWIVHTRGCDIEKQCSVECVLHIHLLSVVLKEYD